MPTPENPQPPQTILGGTPALVEVGVQGAERLSKFRPEQVLTITSLMTTIVGMALTIYLVMNIIGDRANERDKWQITVDSVGRSNDEQRETERKFFQMMDEKRSVDTNSRLKMVLEHCSSESEKARINDAARWDKYTKAVADLIKAKKVDPNDHEGVIVIPLGPIPDVMPDIAPPPREVVRASELISLDHTDRTVDDPHDGLAAPVLHPADAEPDNR